MLGTGKAPPDSVPPVSSARVLRVPQNDLQQDAQFGLTVVPPLQRGSSKTIPTSLLGGHQYQNQHIQHHQPRLQRPQPVALLLSPPVHPPKTKPAALLRATTFCKIKKKLVDLVKTVACIYHRMILILCINPRLCICTTFYT